VSDRKKETAPNGGPISETSQTNSSTSSVLLDKILASLSQVKKVSGGYTALCPFHDDHKPSLMVFENGGFNCHASSCGEHGNHFRLAEQLGIDTGIEKRPKQSLNAFREYLGKRLGVEPSEVEKVASQLNIRANKGALSFMIAMPPSQFVGYVTHNPGKEPKYLAPSREYLHKYGGRNDLKGVLFGLDLALNMVTINRLDEKIPNIRSNLLLTEGYFDVLGCLAHGIPAAAVMGMANGSEEAIRRVYNNLFEAGISRVMLCFDRDNAGRKFTLDYMKYFLSRPGIWTDVILLPEEYKDINDGLQQEGKAYFTKLELYKHNPIEAFIELEHIEEEIEKGGFERHIALMKVARFFSEMHKVHRERVDHSSLIERLGASQSEWNALFEELPLEREKERIKNEMTREGRIFLENIESDPVGAFQRLKDRGELSVRSLEKRKPISVAEELPEILEEIRHEGDGHRLHDASGIDNIVIQPVDLVTIAAATGVGKTTFALNVADYFLKDKRRVLFVSYEINRGRLFSQLLALRGSTEKRTVYRNLKKKNTTVAISPDYENLSIIADPAFTVEELTRLVGKYQEERPLDLIIVDYDQLAQTEGRFDNEERRVSFISQTLKGITLDYGVPVILLSQISKEGLLRFSRQKEFDSSIVLKLEPPLKKDSKGKKREMTDEELKEYYEESKREVIVLVDKYRDGQAKREYSIMIDFETGRIPSKSEYDPISNPDPREPDNKRWR